MEIPKIELHHLFGYELHWYLYQVSLGNFKYIDKLKEKYAKTD